MNFNITGRKKTRFLLIENLEPDSLADQAGLKQGDTLESINAHPVRDVIDLRFYETEPELHLIVHCKEKRIRLYIPNPEQVPLGIIPSPMEFRYCGNHCQFCFIDQNPRGMRPGIYLKDEDYRLSFMHGNYVTLTNASQHDLNRIAEQRLSPLYISIHAVDPVIRKQLLGIKKDDRLMNKMQFLADHDIEMHGQIVLCPGINDNGELDRTIQRLASFYPHLLTLAVVPVGLTKHRHGLPEMQPVTSDKAALVIQQVDAYQKQFRETGDHDFVYLSDEFYLLADAAIPEAGHYGEYWQIENGVGMTRMFLNEFYQDSQFFPKSIPVSQKIVIVTGLLAAPVLQKHVLPVLSKIRGLSVTLLPVENHFYGASVTVSGLLTGRDIFNAVQHRMQGAFQVFLPENCVNYDGVFLDNMTPGTLGDLLKNQVSVISGFDALWN